MEKSVLDPLLSPRALVAGFFLTLVFGFAGFYANGVPKSQLDQSQGQMRSQEVLNRLDTLSKEIAEVSTFYAIYQRTHATPDYQNYAQAAQAAQQALADIGTLTQDNPIQQVHIASVRQAFSSELDRFTHNLQSPPVAQGAAPADQTPPEADDIAHGIEKMRHEEGLLLQERRGSAYTEMMIARVLFFLSIGLLYLSVMGCYWAMRKVTVADEAQLKMADATAQAHKAIEARIVQIVKVQQEINYQSLSLQTAMEIIARRAQVIVRADGAAIEMLEDGEMVCRAVSGTRMPPVDSRFRAEGSLSGLSIGSTASLIVEDTQTDNRVDKEACTQAGIRSMMVTPLVYSANAVGTLRVVSGRPRNFSEEDRNTLQLVGGVLGATLQETESRRLRDAHHNLSLSNQMLESHKITLEMEKTELRTHIDTDELTGVKNHRYFQEYLQQECLRAKRYKNALSLLFIKADDFKKYKDTYGAPAGDDMLKQLAAFLKKCTRPSDCVARYNGETFAVILTQTPLEGALLTIERVRQAMHEAAWQPAPAAVSMGASALKNETQDIASLIEEAQKALQG